MWLRVWGIGELENARAERPIYTCVIHIRLWLVLSSQHSDGVSDVTGAEVPRS